MRFILWMRQLHCYPCHFEGYYDPHLTKLCHHFASLNPQHLLAEEEEEQRCSGNFAHSQFGAQTKMEKYRGW
jgi:hypothetical protein